MHLEGGISDVIVSLPVMRKLTSFPFMSSSVLRRHHTCTHFYTHRLSCRWREKGKKMERKMGEITENSRVWLMSYLIITSNWRIIFIKPFKQLTALPFPSIPTTLSLHYFSKDALSKVRVIAGSFFLLRFWVF